MKRFKTKKKYIISKAVICCLALIFFFTFTFCNYYARKSNKKIREIAKIELDEFMENFLSTEIGYGLLNSGSLKNILIIKLNNENEILYANFDLNKAYYVLETVTNQLNTLIVDLENGNYSVNKKNVISTPSGLALKLPLGIASSNYVFMSLGPKIYVPVNFVGSILTNIKSKITDYGLNNALVELYVTIKINTDIITPFYKDAGSIDYDVLISSTVVNGRVPQIYGGVIERQSESLSIPLQ